MIGPREQYLTLGPSVTALCHSSLLPPFSLSAAQIQRALVRNNQTQRFSQKQALRLHQGLVTSTAEQVALICSLVCYVCVALLRLSLPSVSKVMERLCVRVQQQVCVLRGVGEMEEIQAAKQVLKEARNSRAVSGHETYHWRICIAVSQDLITVSLFLSSSCTLPFVSWLMSCLWTGRCGRDWTLWLVNSPKLLTRSCR